MRGSLSLDDELGSSPFQVRARSSVENERILSTVAWAVRMELLIDDEIFDCGVRKNIEDVSKHDFKGWIAQKSMYQLTLLYWNFRGRSFCSFREKLPLEYSIMIRE